MRKGRYCNTSTLIWVFVGVTLGAGVVTGLGILFRIHLANKWQQYTSLKPAHAPRRSDRIVVFAPHADDETLGCGGMLALAKKCGAHTRVVLVTNGDGFRVAVATAFRTVRVTPAKCIDFAYKRQQETIRALGVLGVARQEITFLGYPDRGIARLWDTNWAGTKLFYSKFTGWDRSPYANCFTFRAPYCGESLLSDISKLLVRERPTDIYLPHPCDNHPDHYATYCFVMAAVKQIESKQPELTARLKLHTYLVHRGDWPVPRGARLGSALAPPHALASGDTTWRSLPLPPEVARLKLRAIRAYRTQTAVEKGFLTSFGRATELFGSIPARSIRCQPDRRMSVDGRTEDWAGTPPVVIDPIRDYVVADLNKGGDVRSIYLCADELRLYVRLDCVRNLSKHINYTLNFRGLSTNGANDWYSVTIRPGREAAPPGTRWAYRDNVLEVVVPLARLRRGHELAQRKYGENLFVQACTTMMNLDVDNTGWHGFELMPATPSSAPSFPSAP